MTSLAGDVMLEALRLSAAALDDQARQLFAAVSLFPPCPNTFSESAAIAIARCSVDTLRRLVNSGILTAAPNFRYGVHRLATQVGHDLADAAVKARFADYFARYCQAHATEPQAIGAEAANILASFECADREQRAAIAAGMSPLLELRGNYRSWEQLLERAAGTGDTTAEIQLQRARCAEKSGLNYEAEQYAQQGFKLADETREQIEPELLAVLGHIEMNLGKNNDAREHLTRAVAKSEQIGSNQILSQALRSLGVVTTRLGAYAQAEQHLRRALEMAEQARDNAALAALCTDIGVVLSKTNRLEAALAAHGRALQAARQIGYSEKEAAALEGCASVHIREGNYDAAASALEDAIKVARRIGHRWYTALILNDLGDVSVAKGDWCKALECFSEAIEAGPPDTPDVRAYSFFGKAQAYAGQNRREEANSSAQQALALFEGMPHEAASEVREWLKHQGVTPPSGTATNSLGR